MSKHTPGPWINSARTIHKESGGWVASCDGHEGGECEYCDANARLVAAAPDMLEALKLSLRALEETDPDAQEHLTDNARGLIYKAINKATGEI